MINGLQEATLAGQTNCNSNCCLACVRLRTIAKYLMQHIGHTPIVCCPSAFCCILNKSKTMQFYFKKTSSYYYLCWQLLLEKEFLLCATETVTQFSAGLLQSLCFLLRCPLYFRCFFFSPEPFNCRYLCLFL